MPKQFLQTINIICLIGCCKFGNALNFAYRKCEGETNQPMSCFGSSSEGGDPWLDPWRHPWRDPWLRSSRPLPVEQSSKTNVESICYKCAETKKHQPTIIKTHLFPSFQNVHVRRQHNGIGKYLPPKRNQQTDSILTICVRLIHGLVDWGDHDHELVGSIQSLDVNQNMITAVSNTKPKSL